MARPVQERLVMTQGVLKIQNQIGLLKVMFVKQMTRLGLRFQGLAKPTTTVKIQATRWLHKRTPTQIQALMELQEP